MGFDLAAVGLQGHIVALIVPPLKRMAGQNCLIMIAPDELDATSVDLVEHDSIIALAALDPHRQAPGVREQGNDFRIRPIIFPVAAALCNESAPLAVGDAQPFPSRLKLADIVDPGML